MKTNGEYSVPVPGPSAGTGTETETDPIPNRWRFLKSAELLSEDYGETDWLVDGMLPCGGLSIMAARPKVGKSTLSRCLAVAIAQGRHWLNRETKQGRVVYAALEEIPSAVQAHFRMIGLQESDPLRIHVGPPPPNGMELLNRAVTAWRPDLVVVDPLMHLIRASVNLNDYPSVIRGLRPFLNMARSSGAHVLLVHHSGKAPNDQGREILGSTGILAIVDCALLLDETDRGRNLYTRGRYGENVEPTELRLENGWVSAGRSLKVLYSMELEGEILEFLEAQTGPVEADAIQGAVGRKRATILKKLANMMDHGRVERSGKGRKNSPYKIFRSRSRTRGRNGNRNDGVVNMPKGYTGGRNIARWFRDTKRAASRRPPIIEVGFKDRRIAPLAAALEFGVEETNLPQRPAFRLGVERMQRAIVAYLKGAGHDFSRSLILPDTTWVKVAIVARDAIRQAYLDFHGAPLSERQIERKAGTEYADEQLVGREGPKLIGHIKAYFNGREVG